MGRPLDKNLVDRFLGAAHQSGRIERGRAARIIGNVYGRMAGNLNPPTKIRRRQTRKDIEGEIGPTLFVGLYCQALMGTHYLVGYTRPVNV